MSVDPVDSDIAALNEFLAAFVSLGWIEGFRVEIFPSLKDLRSAWGSGHLEQVSRTHKIAAENQLIAIEIIKPQESGVGIDLETKSSTERPVFQQIDFL